MLSMFDHFRKVRTPLRRVTIRLEENVVRWARVEAARMGTTVSRLLGEIMKGRMLAKRSYKRSMRRALARQPFMKTDGRYLSRDEVHERFRRP